MTIHTRSPRFTWASDVARQNNTLPSDAPWDVKLGRTNKSSPNPDELYWYKLVDPDDPTSGYSYFRMIREELNIPHDIPRPLPDFPGSRQNTEISVFNYRGGPPRPHLCTLPSTSAASIWSHPVVIVKTGIVCPYCYKYIG